MSKRTCGTIELHHRLLEKSAAYREARSRMHEEMPRFIEAGTAARVGVQKIPVVVHVVYNTPAQNISDEQIRSQIEVLNRDFRAQNPDVAQVPEPWKQLVTDAQIEFYLAAQDPNGRPTNGITRTQTNRSVFEMEEDSIKSKAAGGADPWSTDRYLNLWVAPKLVDRSGNNLLGYATFPEMMDFTQGVVILHAAFGATGTATAPYHLGRTAVHEVGHFLNLEHIWGESRTSCTDSDEISDTPNQKGPNYGKPNFPHISCNNTPNGDMFVNYMDYVDDSVMVMFTEEQVARMKACLAGPRASLPKEPIRA